MNKINLLILLNTGILFVALIEPSPSDILFLFLLFFAFKRRDFIFSKMRKQKLFFLLLFVFLIISAIPVLNNHNPYNSLLYYLITSYLILYSFVIFSFSDESNFNLIIKVYVIGSSIAAIVGMLGYLGFLTNILTYDSLRTKSLFKDPNVFGPYLIPAALFLFNNIKERNLFKSMPITLVLLSVNFIGIILSFSRGAYLSLAVTLFLYLILNTKKMNYKKIFRILIIFSLVLCFVWIFLLSESWKDFFISRLSFQSYDNIRFQVQAKGFGLSMTHFWGVGPGEFDNFIAAYFNGPVSAHSLYIRTIAESGIIGTVIFFSSFIYIIVKLLSVFKYGIVESRAFSSMLISLLTGILVNSIVIDSIHWRHLWLFVGLSLSLIDTFLKEEKPLDEGLTFEVISDIEKLDEYKVKWDSILNENKNSNPFLEIPYMKTYWKYFGSNKELFIIVLRKNDEILGFCPLMKEKKFLHREISFIGKGYSPYMDFIIGDDYREESLVSFLHYLKDIKGSCIINLYGFYENSSNLPIINKFLEGKKHYVKFIPSWYINIKNKESFDSFFATRKKHYSINAIRKKGNKLKKLGNISYRNIDIENYYYTFYLHNKRWLKKLDGHKYSENTKEFFKELIINKDLPLRAEIKGLYLNDRLIAYGYIIKYINNFIFYRIGHEEDFNLVSPGSLFTCILIEDAFHQEYETFDFITGYERFKEEWTDEKMNIYAFIIPGETLLADILFFLSHLKFTGRNLLKKSSLMVTFKKKYLGKLKYGFSPANLVNIKNTFVNKIRNLLYSDFQTAPENLSLYKAAFYTIDDLEDISDFCSMDKKTIIKKFLSGDNCVCVKENEGIIFCSYINDSKIYENYIIKKYSKGEKSMKFLINIVNSYIENNSGVKNEDNKKD